MKGNDSNVFTGGVGFAPFNSVHVDLMGLYGEDETWGAGGTVEHDVLKYTGGAAPPALFVL